MGRLEDCFGSDEAAQLYGLEAFEEPILRLSFEEADFGDVGSEAASKSVYMRALAGIVVSPDVIEPTHHEIPYPAIQVKPVSSASITVPRSPKHIRQNGEYTITVIDEAHSLLIRKPVREPGLFESKVKDMIQNTEGAITVVRALPIRELVQQLKRQRDIQPHARILHDLTKIALLNIW